MEFLIFLIIVGTLLGGGSSNKSKKRYTNRRPTSWEGKLSYFNRTGLWP